ncbi:cytidylyltransferase domain-containing protein [Magnetovibrio sp.]|uniref:cytidylyltransferase domain-containing protein n=1 Tax=Magnetovibrio sp. TaxID=2024836 RepID=UPI002F924B02
MTHNPKIAAIIQARMSSSRLPGKIMLDLAGKPVLWHVFHRLKKSTRINQIILATTTDSCDDVLVDYAHEHGVDVVRGSRDNVLSRFAEAVDLHNPDYIVRVTSDCPMLDPQVIDNLIEVLIKEQGDYSTWNPHVVTLHGGFEPFTRDLFQRIIDEGADNPVAQEHVFGYLNVNPNLGRMVGIPAPENHIFDHVRLWLDTPADLLLLRTLYARTGAAPGEIDMDDVATLLHNDPDLRALNSHVRQKQAYESSRNVIFRCDGDAAIGLGHISRMVALATQLRERYATAVHFAVMRGEQGVAMIEDARFPYQLAPSGVEEAAWLDALIRDKGAHALVLDIRTDLSGDALDLWRDSGVLCVLIDDIGPRLEHADLVFCPPTPRTLALNGRPGRPDIKAGWEWLILRDPFSHKTIPPQNPHPHALVSCGASDPAGFTRMALQALNDVTETIDIDVVAGPLFTDRAALAQIVESHRHAVHVHDAPQDLAGLMAASDIGIVSFGVTAAEMAAMGLPAIYLCLSDDHAQSASVFEQAKLGINLGRVTPDDASRLARTCAELLNDPSRLQDMSKTSRDTVDGRGAARIAEIIAERIQAGRQNQLPA